MNIRKSVFSPLLLYAATTMSALSAQSFDALSISVFNQNIAMPGRGLFPGRNPGFALGAEKLYHSGNHCSLYQNISIGYYRHQAYGGEMNVVTQFGFRYSPGRLFAEFKLGPGYALQSPKQQQFKHVDDEYQEHTLAHKLTAGGGFGTGLVLNRYSIALGWNMNVIYPYLKQESILMPRQSVEISFRYKLSGIEKS